MYPNVSNTNQQILLAIHEDLWLSVGLHKRTRCCHSQWKCYRPLKSICAANSRDQCYCHQLLDYLHPSVSTCAAVWRLQRIVCGRQHTFLKKKWELTCFAQNWIRAHVSYISLISISNICMLHICISTATISTYQTRAILIWRRVWFRAPVQSLTLTQAVRLLKPHAN